MNKRLLVGATLGLFVFGVALAATYLCLEHFAFSRRETGPGVYSAHNWVHQIGLTKEQEQKLEPLEKSLQQDLKKIQVKLAQDRIALCSLMRQEPSDTKELDKYINQVAQLEAEQQRRVIQHLLVVRNILTPTQRDKFFAAIMQDICVGCRTAVPGQKCLCGMHTTMKG